MTRNEHRTRSGRSSKFIKRSTRFAIYARDGFDCVHCKGMFPPAYDGSGLTLDHIVPRALGGKDSPDNLVASCFRCNRAKSDRMGTVKALQRQAQKPLNRELGRVLAEIEVACKRYGLVHPLTVRSLQRDRPVSDDSQLEIQGLE